MALGAAYLSGRLSIADFKELANGNYILRLNLSMRIEGFEGAPATEEIIPLSVFGSLAPILRRKIEKEGHNYGIAICDVRCRPYKNKDGETKAFPSFNVKSICSEKRGCEKNTAPDGGDDEVPF
ncbi:MAG: hypothetical protein LBB26_03935 [Puniceicoccales bacterium]|nr:hypothetical protein [Puniceicoccales bacterium]